MSNKGGRFFDAEIVSLSGITVSFNFGASFTKTVTDPGGNVVITQVTFTGSASSSYSRVGINYSGETAGDATSEYAVIRDTIPPVFGSPNAVSRIVQNLKLDTTYNDEPIFITGDLFNYTYQVTTIPFGESPIVDPPVVDEINVAGAFELNVSGELYAWNATSTCSPFGAFTVTYLNELNGRYEFFVDGAVNKTGDVNSVGDVATLSGISSATVSQTYEIPTDYTDDDGNVIEWSGWTSSYNWSITV
jgi:hypothetical protein